MMTKIILAAGLSLCALQACAAEIEVHMLNRGADGQAMVFEPSAIKAQPGDVITFVPVDKGHDAVSIPGLLPDGVADMHGPISQTVSITVDKPGAYVFKCAPHYGMGMVALVVVGEAPTNLAAVRDYKLPKMARDRLNAALVRLGL